MSKPNISASDIDTAPMEKGGSSTVPVAPDLLQPDPILAQKLGLIGKIIGHGDNARMNIAASSIFILILLIVFCLGVQGMSSDAEFKRQTSGLITPFLTTLSGLIGYVIGKQDKTP